MTQKPAPAPSPQEKLKADISRAQSDLNSLQTSVRLTTIRDQVEDLHTTVGGLDQRVKDLRAKGYVFDRELESRAAALLQQWTPLQPTVINLANEQAARLDAEMRGIESLMMQLTSRSNNPSLAAPFLGQVQSAITTMENKVRSAESAVRGAYDQFQSNLTKVTAQLQRMEKMLAWFASASFTLGAAEYAVNAVEAVWAPNGKEDRDDPKGQLFLTDQRILFEQNQEIAKKKVLFITTEKEKVQKLLFEFPVVLVNDVTTSKQGFLKNEDHLDIRLDAGGPFPTCHLHIFNQPCEEWDALLGKVKGGELDADRVVAVSAEVLEKVKNAPAKCPTCGGTINKPVLRGQDTIKCDYCGSIIRL